MRARCRSTPRGVGEVEPGPPPALDPERHYLEGAPEHVAMYTLALDSINFGSGWFPTLRKRPGQLRLLHGGLGAGRPLPLRRPVGHAGPARRSTARRVAAVLGQEPGHELMSLYARALNDLGAFMGDRGALDVVDSGGRLGGAAGGAARRGHAPVRRPRLLQARADPAERPGIWPGWPSSATSTGSRSSRTTSCRTSCGSTGCCATTTLAAANRRRRAARARPRGARDPGLRGTRLRADRG